MKELGLQVRKKELEGLGFRPLRVKGWVSCRRARKFNATGLNRFWGLGAWDFRVRVQDTECLGLKHVETFAGSGLQVHPKAT